MQDGRKEFDLSQTESDRNGTDHLSWSLGHIANESKKKKKRLYIYIYTGLHGCHRLGNKGGVGVSIGDPGHLVLRAVGQMGRH